MPDLSQRAAPLYQAARIHLQHKYIPLHVPLHGQGAGAPALGRSGFAPLLRWDLTEVGNLDDLHLPSGPLHRAQLLAARLFGAARSFFLVNGVSGGLLALLLAVVRPGEKVLLSRLSHKAVLHGLMLCGAVPVYLPVEREPHSGFPLNVAPSTVEAALRQHPDARLLLLTSPTYWGVTADLQQAARLARRCGVLFAVDEAHGGHLQFYGDIPHSAAAGADFWLHSGHKSLGALTPGAYLHQTPLHASPALRFWLQALQTSSPSYPVMISLDLARRQAALKGKSLFRQSRRWACMLRSVMQREGAALLTEEMVKAAGFALDPCRITILLPRGGGIELAGNLAHNCRIQVELAGETSLLAVCGPAQLGLSTRALGRALGRAAAAAVGKGAAVQPERLPPFCFARPPAADEELPPFPLPPRAAAGLPAHFLPLRRCAGQISAEMVVLSPPGIPLLVPGEPIDRERIDLLLELRSRGSRFQGAADPALHRLKVIENFHGVPMS